jgi:hypothetical protein
MSRQARRDVANGDTAHGAGGGSFSGAAKAGRHWEHPRPTPTTRSTNVTRPNGKTR